MIFVVEAICRRTCARFAQSTFPVVPSIRIAERALILIPCPGTGPVWWMSGLVAPAEQEQEIGDVFASGREWGPVEGRD